MALCVFDWDKISSSQILNPIHQSQLTHNDHCTQRFLDSTSWVSLSKKPRNKFLTFQKNVPNKQIHVPSFSCFILVVTPDSRLILYQSTISHNLLLNNGNGNQEDANAFCTLKCKLLNMVFCQSKINSVHGSKQLLYWIIAWSSRVQNPVVSHSSSD